MSQHDEAIAAFRQGRYPDASRVLRALLDACETSELWNDWAAVQLASGQANQAEEGFSRALALDPENMDAAANLGALLLQRGDSTRALGLLTRALPYLPVDQQQIVTGLLAPHAPEQIPTPEMVSSRAGALRILVIGDTFPAPHGTAPRGDDRDRWLFQLLRTLRTQDREVTFIAREAVNGKSCEPLLREAGIRTYSNDAERLPLLGQDSHDSSWSFCELLDESQFDIAILIQSFSRGISVPEQYLDDLRQRTPGTRVAVFADELYVSPLGSEAKDLVDFERAEDWAARQWEIFERADAVLVRREPDAAFLRQAGRNLQVEVVTHDSRNAELTSAQNNILAHTPKPHVAKPFSVMLVETLFREQLSTRIGEDRVLGQFESYARLGEQLLREGKGEQAHAQLRHIFGRSPQAMHAGYFASQVFIIMMRCYRILGRLEMSERYACEARRRVIAKTLPAPPIGRGQDAGLRFTVIIPTYNRLAILRKCLAAMEAQTLPSADFEVIVIDDGSSDGTPDALANYRPPFRFQYLRQTNSGTGAARRNGVAHASGEFLLLMNDDTICDPDLLEQHLLTQTRFSGERWAVLGNFEYPVAARQRALTRYFGTEPFMFPQVSMEAACPYGYSHFITCNLSVRRDAVIEAGSFDSTYKLSEDTELGIRLYEMGYRVLYHPQAHAFHDHLPYPARNLIRRARVYGADYFYMFGRHPRVMEEWAMPVNLTAMDGENAGRIVQYVEQHRSDVEQAFAALERWDLVDFETLLDDQPETATMVLNLFRQAVPAIHWFYLFETMLQTMTRELHLGNLSVGPAPAGAALAAGASV